MAPHFTVYLVGMVLGPVICIVEFARAPVDFKLFLAFAVAKPMEAHVPGFGPFLLHVGMNETVGGGIVSFEWSWWLWMAKINQSLSDVNGILGIEE